MVDTILDGHEQELARLRRVVGWVTVVGSWLVGLASLAAGLWCGMRVPIALGLFFFVQALVLTGFWSTLKWRQKAFALRLQDPSADVGRVRFLSRFLPYLAGAVAVSLPFYSSWAPGLVELWEGFEPWSQLREPDSDANEAQLYAWGFVVVSILSALFAQYFASVARTVAPEARGASCWFRAGTWLSLVGAASLFVRALDEPWEEELTTRILLGIVVFLGVELLLRAFWTTWMRFYDRVPHPGGRVGTDLFSLRLLFSRFNPSGSIFAVLAEAFGIDLRGAWALTFMRRSLAPLAGGLLLVGWLSTAFVMVESSDVGLVERFGKLDREPLQPGLHFVLPWPMHRVTRVPVHRVQTIPIGFTGAKDGASMLWTVEHADEEYKLLLGEGRDLVTINATLHYRIGDPVAFTYNLQNPDETLAIVADRVLMQRTVGRSLDGVLSENLSAFGLELEQTIQAESDRRELGLEIVDLTLVGLHPPVNVAEDYQKVVGARIDQTTKMLEAETHRMEERPRAEGEVAKLKNEAQSHRVTRLATARGEATAFRALLESYSASPQVFGIVRYLQSIEAQLTGKKFHVLDHTIEEAGGAVWLLD